MMLGIDLCDRFRRQLDPSITEFLLTRKRSEVTFELRTLLQRIWKLIE